MRRVMEERRCISLSIERKDGWTVVLWPLLITRMKIHRGYSSTKRLSTTAVKGCSRSSGRHRKNDHYLEYNVTRINSYGTVEIKLEITHSLGAEEKKRRLVEWKGQEPLCTWRPYANGTEPHHMFGQSWDSLELSVSVKRIANQGCGIRNNGLQFYKRNAVG